MASASPLSQRLLRSTAPPSVLPDISPTRGEIGSFDAPRLILRRWRLAKPSGRPISPLWGRCPAGQRGARRNATSTSPRPRSSACAAKYPLHRRDQLALRHGHLRRAAFAPGGVVGDLGRQPRAFDQILDLHLALGALVAALDDDARGCRGGRHISSAPSCRRRRDKARRGFLPARSSDTIFW